MEAYQPPVVTGKLTRGPLEYAAVWKIAQRLTDKPVKFGTISGPLLARMMWDDFYKNPSALAGDLDAVINAELKELAASGCRVIQLEEPPHHFASLNPQVTDKDLEEMTRVFNTQVEGVDAEIWVHTCWGNPNQQRCFWETPSYERALPHMLQFNADVITLECASTCGKDLPLFAKLKTDKKIAIGVVNHTQTTVEPPEVVANLIRKALEYIPPERLVITTDCGFGREGLSRRIAYYKLVSLVQGTNLVRRELGLPEARIRAADPKLWFVEL
jgi:5-methyltetrahydropteroyltriglutamate--homocysteine methyltransferase